MLFERAGVLFMSGLLTVETDQVRPSPAPAIVVMVCSSPAVPAASSASGVSSPSTPTSLIVPPNGSEIGVAELVLLLRTIQN